jgi:hypothetical protein
MPGIEHNAPNPKVTRMKMNVSNFLFTGSIYIFYEQLTIPSYAMAGASETSLIINRLHRQDNFKKCAARPFACSGFVRRGVGVEIYYTVFPSSPDVR